MNLRWFLQFLMVVLLAQDAMAVMAPTPVLNPTNYTCPSGRFVIEVDPTDLYGRGPANYRLVQAGKVVWSGEKPFTLYNAGVTEDGIVAGYTYTYGLDGFSLDRQASGNPGEFQVIILSAAGGLLLEEKAKRTASRYLHARPNPLATGLIVDGANDRLVVRLNHENPNKTTEWWWCYQLSTGKALGKKELISSDPNARFPTSAKLIRGTPLILIHYWQYADGERGGRFVLVDPSLKEVWSLNLPRDYSAAGNEAAEDRLRNTILAGGAVLDNSVTNRFEIRVAATDERVTYEVRQTGSDNSTWKVSEVHRTKFTENPAMRAEPLTFPDRPLRQLGKFTFGNGAPGTAPPIRKIASFDFDAQGRFGFIRETGPKRFEFVLTSESGTVLRELPLDIPEILLETRRPLIASLTSNLWVVTASTNGVGGHAQAWRIDASSDEIALIPEFRCHPISAIRGLPNGGFVVLATERLKYSMEDEITAFDAAGRKTWQLKEHHSDRERSLLSPEAITVTSHNQVALLDNIRKTVQLFDEHGGFVRSFSLKTAWKREPNYPTDIAAVHAGGFVVLDFNGTPPVVWMNGDGKIINQFALKHPDGQAINPTSGIGVSPSGRLWISDGDCLIRVTDNGKVDLVLGSPPAVGRLDAVATLTVDQNSRLYAVDTRAGSIHVFDGNGKIVRVRQPEPGDFEGNFYGAHIAAAPNGDVYSRNFMDFHDNPRWLVFSAVKTERIERRLGLDDIQERVYPLPTEDRLLVIGYQNAFIIAPTGKVLRKIDRKPNHDWLATPRHASVAPNGSFAIITHHNQDQSWQANLYDSLGAPLRTVSMPTGSIATCVAFTGKYIITRTQTKIIVLDETGKPVQEFVPPIEDFGKDYWECFTTEAGREVWFTCAQQKAVVRFESPQ